MYMLEYYNLKSLPYKLDNSLFSLINLFTFLCEIPVKLERLSIELGNPFSLK